MFSKAPMYGKQKVLLFIDGPVPTEAHRLLADKLTTTKQIVCFRNAQQVTDNDCVEQCSFVAGDVPKQYAKVPRADDDSMALFNQAEVAPSGVGGKAEPVLTKEDLEQLYRMGAVYGSNPDGVLPIEAPEDAVRGFDDARAEFLLKKLETASTPVATPPVAPSPEPTVTIDPAPALVEPPAVPAAPAKAKGKASKKR